MNTRITNELANKTILVVDDEPDSLLVATDILEMFDVNVITANDGDQGFQKAIEHKPYFIISDLSMPQVSGWQLLKKCKEDTRTQEIPIIALTAHAMKGDRERAIAAGFHNYITKPLTPERFIRDLIRIIKTDS